MRNKWIYLVEDFTDACQNNDIEIGAKRQ